MSCFLSTDRRRLWVRSSHVCSTIAVVITAISGGTVQKKLLLLTIAVLCLGTFASADSFTFFTSRAQQNPDDIIDWGQLGAPATFVNTPALVFSAGLTNSALVGNTNGGQFITAMEGDNWDGNFDFGENLVWTGNANLGVGSGGPFAIVLANPVATVGIGIQTDFFWSVLCHNPGFRPRRQPLRHLYHAGQQLLFQRGRQSVFWCR